MKFTKGPCYYCGGHTDINVFSTHGGAVYACKFCTKDLKLKRPKL